MSRTVFLPIKPKYSHKILTGEKKWEFRRSIPKSDFSQVVIYSSSPLKKIQAIFMVETVISGTPEEVWSNSKEEAGISFEEYSTYFRGAKCAYAIKIGQIFPTIHVDPKELGIRVPQSFSYLNLEQVAKLNALRQVRVFLGGIHGSGKTYLCSHISSNFEKVSILKCSELIGYKKSRLNVQNVQDNQRELVSGLESLNHVNEMVLLDGHFSLLKKQHPVGVTPSVFIDLKLSAICVLIADPQEASARLLKRDQIAFDPKILFQLQSSELENALKIGRILGVPMIISNDGNEIIRRLLTLMIDLRSDRKFEVPHTGELALD